MQMVINIISIKNREFTMKKNLLLPTVAMLIISAQATATQTSVIPTPSKHLSNVKGELSFAPGWCSNIPLTYEDARLMGAKCN